MGKRNYSIDLLRIVSMFMIVVTHCVTHGGMILTAKGPASYLDWTLTMLGVCGLNCYGLISGYVGYKENDEPRPNAKFLSIWISTVFYGVLAVALLGIFNILPFDWNNIFIAVTPIAHCEYWYVTAYIVVFLLMPYMNILFQKLTKSQMEGLAITLIVLFSFFAVLASLYGEMFGLNSGMSAVWLLVLYTLGAWIKKCEVFKNAKTVFLILGQIACLAVTWCIFKFTPYGAGVMYYYLPTYLFFALFTMRIFMNIKTGKIASKIISIVAPATFGVYLIHDNTFIRDNLISMKFMFVEGIPFGIMVLELLGIALAIFVGCTLIELVRLWLFKVLQINRGISFLQKKIEGIGRKKESEPKPESGK